MILTFNSKAETLAILQQYLKSAKIKPAVRFNVSSWKLERSRWTKQIQNTLDDRFLIVRSSCVAEDCEKESLAGHFASVPFVSKQDEAAIIAAVDRVIQSYGDRQGDDDEVLVQGQIENFNMIGVAFTADLTTLAPYYVINYDASHDAAFDSVTNGGTRSLRTYVQFKAAPCLDENPRLAKLIETLKELEKLYDNDALDVEFAFDELDELYILQVRPIVRHHKGDSIGTEILGRALFKIESKIKKINADYPYLYGSRTILGVMPDWNPAEIIGTKPRPLALSLYKELITDSVWAYQRDNYGYKNLRGFPLIRSLMGLPYIDVRITFNSFVPKDVSDDLSHKLVNHYLAQLEANPINDDKVEFRIVLSCYHLTSEEKFRELKAQGFSEAEVRELRIALLKLTNNVIHPERGLYKGDLKKIDILVERQAVILRSDLSTLEKVYWLIEDCKRFGTLPFAGLARAAFIATQFLHSIVELGVIDSSELNAFMGSIESITKQFSRDSVLLAERQLSKDEFLKRYGHLRPGTYDILSRRYDEDFEHFFSENHIKGTIEDAEIFSISQEKMRELDSLLVSAQLECSGKELLDFIRQAIAAREYSKFVFTKSLSDCLSILERFGKRFNYSRDDLSYLNIKTILDLYSMVTNHDMQDIFNRDIAFNKRGYRLTQSLKLPQLIVSEKDIYAFHLKETEPNFVSDRRVVAEVLPEHQFRSTSLNGRIVLIRSADPGYDWIFAKGIAGLITMFGGANSHMAVRAAELQIPAVIGAGEANFAAWSKAKRLDIDCSNRLVRIV